MKVMILHVRLHSLCLQEMLEISKQTSISRVTRPALVTVDHVSVIFGSDW
jgi:hypothetical protein